MLSRRIRWVASDPAFAFSRPCFSPEGDRVLFMRTTAAPVITDNRSPWGLWTAPVEGGEPQPLFEDPSLVATRPDWCHASGRIAFTGIRDGRAELWILQPDGSDPRRVPVGEPPGSRIFYPSWYPDGKRLVVTDYKTHQVIRVDPDTGQTEPLTDPSRVWAGMAAAGEGASGQARVAFAGQVPSDHFDPGRNVIWVQEGLDQPRPLDGRPGRMPAWAPGGGSLVFAAPRWRLSPRSMLRRLARPPSAIYVQEATGSSGFQKPPRPLTSMRFHAAHAKWSPDGARLVAAVARRWGGARGIAILDVEIPAGPHGGENPRQSPRSTRSL